MEEHGTVKDAAAMYLYGKRCARRKAYLLDHSALPVKNERQSVSAREQPCHELGPHPRGVQFRSRPYFVTSEHLGSARGSAASSVGWLQSPIPARRAAAPRAPFSR